MPNHVITVFEEQGVAAGLKKLADVIEDGALDVLGLRDEFPEFSALKDRLLNSPEGKAAYAVAKDYFDFWDDGDSPLDAAGKALAKDGGQLAKVLIEDIADWLGIMDRNPVPTEAPSSTDPEPDTPAAA